MYNILITTFILTALLLLAGCKPSENMHTQTVPDSIYKQALLKTDPSNFSVPAAGSDAEAQMLSALEALFTDYTYSNLDANVTQVYAESVYFRDAFKLLTKAEAVREYFLHGLKPVNAVRFEFKRILRKDDEFYIDWIMAIDFKKTPPETWEESIGMSHFRFNDVGQVIFHQDYWDPTDIVYKRIPIVKQLIAYVKRKL